MLLKTRILKLLLITCSLVASCIDFEPIFNGSFGIAANLGCESRKKFPGICIASKLINPSLPLCANVTHLSCPVAEAGCHFAVKVCEQIALPVYQVGGDGVELHLTKHPIGAEKKAAFSKAVFSSKIR